MTISKTFYFSVGLICMIGLMILGWIFFRERVAFCDTAYQAVYMMIERRPFVIWIRAGSVLPQFIPLAAIWCHSSLKTVMILHSLSFLIFFLVIYLIAFFYSRTQLLFFVIPIYLLLITTDVFYWPQSELQQGMLWLCLYAVLLFEHKWSGLAQWRSLLIQFVFLLWIQFFHPLLFFPILFLLIYYYDQKGRLYTPQGFYHILLSCLSFAIRFVVGTLDVYEKGKLNIGKALKVNLPHFLSLDSVHTFISKIHSDYLVYTLVVIFTVAWLFIKGKYIRAAALTTFSLGYWLLIMVAYPVDSRFYTQNMLLPLAFIAALPVVAEVIPLYKNSMVAIIILMAIIIKFGLIYHAHIDYTGRFAIYEPYFDYVKKKNLNGVFVDDKLINQKKAIITWASGYESALLSSLASPDSCRIVQIDPDPAHYSYALDFDTSMVTIFGIWGQSQLPKEYFNLHGRKYEVLTHRP